jgi:HSP20 family protein
MRASTSQDAQLHGPGREFDSWINPPGEHARTAVQRIPLADLGEADNEHVLKVELPGVKDENVRITARDGTVTITGDRPFEVNTKKRGNGIECAPGRFRLVVLLPHDARPPSVGAEFRDGVLTVHLVKTRATTHEHAEVMTGQTPTGALTGT